MNILSIALGLSLFAASWAYAYPPGIPEGFKQSNIVTTCKRGAPTPISVHNYFRDDPNQIVAVMSREQTELTLVHIDIDTQSARVYVYISGNLKSSPIPLFGDQEREENPEEVPDHWQDITDDPRGIQEAIVAKIFSEEEHAFIKWCNSNLHLQ